MTRSVVLLLCLLGSGAITQAQLVVDNANLYDDASYLVNNILIGGGVTAPNITFNGFTGIPDTTNGRMIGYFNSDLSNIGLSLGSSCPVEIASNPNTGDFLLHIEQDVADPHRFGALSCEWATYL